MYSQSVPALISKNVGSTLSMYKTWGGIMFNVMDTAYGAKGDGINDDTAAINAAIAACPAGGTVLFPTPSVKYRVTATIEINKPIKLMGFNRVYDVDGNLEKAEMIEFAVGVFKGLHVTSYDVVIENLVIKMLDTSNSLIAGIDLDSSVGGGMRFTRIQNCFVYLPGVYGAGYRGHNLIISSFEQCQTYQGKYGFYFYGTGTSITFESCWARAQSGSGAEGYHIDGYTYLAFVQASCDSTNNPDYAYGLYNCKSISFDGCGGELMGKTMFRLDNCDGISIDGAFAYNMNQAGTAIATFAEITNGTKNVVFAACVDTTVSALPNTRIDATSKYPVYINCDFPQGFSDNGSLFAPPNGIIGYLQIGHMILGDNPLGSADAVFYNRGIMTAGQQLGVLKADLTAALGYFDVDGTIVVGSVASLPTAGSSYRRKIAVVLGNGTTTADVLYICLMSSTGTYSWKQIISG